MRTVGVSNLFNKIGINIFWIFFGHDVSQLSQGQNGFASGQGAVLGVNVADDFFQFENAQV